MDVIRFVPEAEVEMLKEKTLPASLEKAMLYFVLAGAARAYRGEGEKPATMLIHPSQFKTTSIRSCKTCLGEI